jgi:hypothetical protein
MTQQNTKAKERPSAIKSVKHSGLELVRRRKVKGKLATARDYAKAAHWKPWTRDPDMEPGELFPSQEITHDLGIGARLAYAIMLKSPEELIEMHKSVEHETMDEMMAHLSQTEENLKSLASMVKSAYLRILATGCKHALARGKFKFRDGSSARACPSDI